MEFKRDVFRSLSEDTKKIIIIFGARQIGKTYLLDKLNKKFKNSKLYRLEEPDELSQFNLSDSEILKLLRKSGDIVLIDEFQYLKNASHLFKAIYDSGKKPKIYATGSSAIEMHKHLKESLAGRYRAYYLKPLSCSEFLSGDKNFTLNEFLTYGALPGTYNPEENQTIKDRKHYLNQIISTYIQKDIKSLIKEENISAFNNLLFILAEQQGQIISSANLSRELRLSIGTVDRYLDILEQTFVIYCLKSFSGNLSNELKKSKKYYFYDLGVRNALLKDFSSVNKRKDKGKVWETFIYHYLLNLQDISDTEILFWRTSNNVEVDFVWLRNREPIPIEVKSVISASTIPSSIKGFIRAYTNSPFAVIVNEKHQLETEYNGKKVYFIRFDEVETLKELLA